MAYTKLLVRSSNLNSLIDYVTNEEKTVLQDDLQDGLDYAMNEEKTRRGEIRYVSGINCFPETAAQEMMDTKRHWSKLDGRLAYHLIQSFAPGENVTPELAHEIGRQYAEQLLPGYEVVVSTHLDKDHTHNHIVYNSVCRDTGEKFHLTKTEFYEKIRGISDGLCREHGLPVIEFEYGERMTYKEWMEKKSRGGTWKEIIRKDVEAVLGRAQSMGEFMIGMEDLEYEVDTSGKYAKLRPFDKERWVRLKTIGFSDDVIERAISLNRGHPQPKTYKRGRRYYKAGSKYYPKRRLTSFEAQYIRYMYMLGKIKSYPKRTRIETSEYRQFDRYKAQLKYVAQNRISDVRDLRERRGVLQTEFNWLEQERKQLKGEKDRLAPVAASQVVYEKYCDVMDEYKRVGYEHEAMERYAAAVAFLKEHGYDTPEKLAALSRGREILFNRIAANKKHCSEVKEELKIIDEIGGSSEKMRQYKQHEKQEVKETWNQKQSKSHSREEKSL